MHSYSTFANRASRILSCPTCVRPLAALLCALSLLSANSLAQCPFTNSLGPTANPTATTLCLGSGSLTASSANTAQRIIWYKDGNLLQTVGSTTTPTGDIVAGVGSPGSSPQSLGASYALAFDPNDNLYVADAGNSRIQQFPPGTTEGSTAVPIAGTGAATPLNYPQGLCVDALGNIYVADTYNHRVLEFTSNPTSASVGSVVAGTGTQGSGANQLNYPTAVAVDASGNIFVLDAGNARVQKWAPGALSGSTVAGGNGSGSALNQFAVSGGNGPNGLSLDASANVYVSDTYNNRVLKFLSGSTSATSGTMVAGTGTAAGGSNQLNGPFGIYVDGSGNLYIADQLSNRIQLWLSGATEGITVAGPGGLINNPSAVTLDGSGNIYVVDEFAGQVIEFPPFVLPNLNLTYTPTAAGVYTAALTDLYGCSVTTNQVTVTAPVTPTVSITASATSFCTTNQVQFMATPQNGGDNPVYEWMDNGIAIGGVSGASPTLSGSSFANGDIITCQLTSNNSCVTSQTATSNALTLTVKSGISPTVNIVSDPTASCAGQPVNFKANLTNAGTDPAFQWEVNGATVGDNTPTYSSSSLSNGDQIACFVTNEQGCAPAGSNSITAVIHANPTITGDLTYSVAYGQSVLLSPTYGGNIVQYVWSPAAGLSDSSIADPTASPAEGTAYLVKVTDGNGCTDSAAVLVRLLTTVAIPNAFTPNGDGKNDLFYVLGGPVGSIIRDMSIFNRWGQRIFFIHNAAPGDPQGAWDGRVSGSYVSPGTYVYIINLKLASGQVETYRGTVEVVR